MKITGTNTYIDVEIDGRTVRIAGMQRQRNCGKPGFLRSKNCAKNMIPNEAYLKPLMQYEKWDERESRK
ncbi:MAG: hypothetical protein K6E51_00030 [Treponema sp.]|nr:hypothetical protein [Treponema sp.]